MPYELSYTSLNPYELSYKYQQGRPTKAHRDPCEKGFELP